MILLAARRSLLALFIAAPLAAQTRIAIATCAGDLGSDDAKKGAAALWANRDWGGKAAVWDFRSARLTIS